MSLVSDALCEYNLRAFPNIAAPEMKTPVVFGTPGSTEYEYCATFRTINGETIAGASVSVSTGPAVLNGVDRILLQVQEVPAEAKYIRLFKKVGEVFNLLGEQEAHINGLYDEGQATSATEPPVTNTSGRGDWKALGFHVDRPLQRIELMDLQNILNEKTKRMWDSIHKDGDVVTGSCRSAGENQWSMAGYRIYLDGDYHDIPDDTVTITGAGSETVGLTATAEIVDYNEDPKIRNIDEGVGDTYNYPGADRIAISFVWVVSNLAPIKIQEFVDGQPKTATLPIERTMLDKKLAQRTYDLAGNFVVNNFPLDIADHPTDATKLLLKVGGGGKAYPNGWEVQTIGVQSIPFGKARDVGSVNNSATDAYSAPGGSVTTANSENFDLDGLSVKLRVGSGNYHTVTFSSDGMSAAQVAAQIVSEVNAYPTSGTLVYCPVADGKFQIRAADGQDLTIAVVADDAYTELGISTGTYTPQGTRIYKINDAYIKGISDLHYPAVVVEAVVHNGNTHVDALSGSTVLSILGASDTQADAYDGKWDYHIGVDFVRDGNNISYAGMGGSEPVHGATHYVAYRHNYNAAKGSRLLVRVIDAQVVKGAEDGQDTLVFTGATSITRVSTGEAVAGLSGEIKDAVRILRVNNSPGQSQDQYSGHALMKNATALTHNSSQIDWSAASSQPSTGATYYVSLELWYHAVEGDFVTADSYDTYADIESYGGLNLRDCVDLRTTGGIRPEPGENVELDYDYYLSRIDKLVLADTGDFALITGTPAKLPVIPNDQANLLTLGILRINPYTYSKGNLRIVSTEPLRITQTGIRNLSDRIERLEYWKIVNDLEKEVAEHPAAVDRVGVLTDALTGYGKFDLGFDKNAISHTAALDRLNRCLMLPATAESKELVVNLPGSTRVMRMGNNLMLQYTPQVFDEQPYATISINAAQDFVYENYVGIMDLNPAVDVFLDQEQLPQINADFDENLSSLLDAINAELANQVIWGGWATTQQVTEITQQINRPARDIVSNVTTTATQSRSGLQTEISALPGAFTIDLGDRVVDISMLGMMRTTDDDGNPIEIHVRVSGLMPNQDHACTMSGIAVDFTYDSGVTDPRGQQGTATYEGKTTVRTDNTGVLTGKFNMPEGVSAGTAPVVVFYYDDPSASWAQAVFSSAGFLQQNQSTTVGIPALVSSTTQVTENQTIVSSSSSIIAHYDPLAQTFVVKDRIRYFAAVGLFFRAKSATMPFTIQCREVINGYPGLTVYANATLQPADITVSEDGTAESIAYFPNVLGLKPGTEYCFVPMPGQTTEFELWAAELGQIDVSTGERVVTQAAEGVLFHSPNNRTWDPWNTRDLKYRLYESIFENDCQIVFNAVSGIEASRIVAAVEQFAAPGTNVVWSYSLDNVSWIPFNPGTDVVLDQIITTVYLRIDVTSLGGSYLMVEQIAGIVLLLHLASADAIWTEELFADDLNYPNKIVAFMDIDADGTNGLGVTSLTPMYSVDNGETWVELEVLADYTPVAQEDPYWRYQFETPGEATLTDATNAEPIVITSAGHGFPENSVVDITGVVGNTNANATKIRLKNVTEDTAELYDAATDLPIAGNGAYESGGTMTLSEFSTMRPRVKFETSNQARTPRVQNVGFVCSKV